MDNNLLDQLLSLLRREKLPSCPATVEANVLRKIRLRQGEERWSFWAELGRFAMEPRFAATALAIGVAFSGLTTMVATELSARPDDVSPEFAQIAEVVELGPLKHRQHLLECCGDDH